MLKVRSLHILAISPKIIRYEVDFLPADKRKFSVALLVWVAMNAQSIQNDKFIIYLEKVKDEVDFGMQISMKTCYKLIQGF